MARQDETSVENKASASIVGATPTMHAPVTPAQRVVGVARTRGARFLDSSGKRSSAALPATRAPMKRRALEALRRCAVSLAAWTTSGQRRKSGRERLRDLLQEYEAARHILIRRVEPRRGAPAIQYRSTRRILRNDEFSLPADGFASNACNGRAITDDPRFLITN